MTIMWMFRIPSELIDEPKKRAILKEDNTDAVMKEIQDRIKKIAACFRDAEAPTRKRRQREREKVKRESSK